MHGQILLHPSSQGKEFSSLQMSMMLAFPTDISAENRDKQGEFLRVFQGEDNKSSLLDPAEMWDCSKRAGPWTEQQENRRELCGNAQEGQKGKLLG